MSLVVCVVACGCSFTIKAPPRDYRPGRDGPPSCDQSAREFAVLDGLAIGIGLLPAAVVAALNMSEEQRDVKSQIGWALPPAMLAAVAALAMGHGRCASAQCEKAHLDYQAWMAAEADRRVRPSGTR
jgi:hypothetical protein